jgi:hypothetical protein
MRRQGNLRSPGGVRALSMDRNPDQRKKGFPSLASRG